MRKQRRRYDHTPEREHLEMARSVRRGLLAAWLLMAAAGSIGAQERIVIRVGTLLDGRGGRQSGATIVVEAGRIRSVGRSSEPATYEFPRLTLVAGLIDTHFGRDGKATREGETPQQTMLYAAENAYEMLMNGFTTA